MLGECFGLWIKVEIGKCLLIFAAEKWAVVDGIFFGRAQKQKKPTSAALVSFVSKRLCEARLKSCCFELVPRAGLEPARSRTTPSR